MLCMYDSKSKLQVWSNDNLKNQSGKGFCDHNVEIYYCSKNIILEILERNRRFFRIMKRRVAAGAEPKTFMIDAT